MTPLLAAGLPEWFPLVAFAIGALLAPWLAIRMAWRSCAGETTWHCPACRTPHDLSVIERSTGWGVFARCNACGTRLTSRRRVAAVALLVGAVFAGYALAARAGWQQTPEVRPAEWAVTGRAMFHLLLIGCLVAATATDLTCYLIPDKITLFGALFAILAATLSGDFQLIHIWVDWSQEVPGLYGPYIPAWCGAHPHWHGLAWSVTGGLVGGGLTWLVRAIASHALQQEALGFGDVTLMTMVGCFLGWQPTVLAFLLAPFCGIVVAAAVKLALDRPYVPYGPFLAVGSYVVLTGWQWFWLRLRLVFGDPVVLAILTGAALAVLWLLLFGLRKLRNMPIRP